MEDYFKMCYLLDIYSALLTDRQCAVLNYYYSENLSVSEIGGILNISRQGVHDTLKKGEELILKYDSKLELLNKYKKNLKNFEILQEKLSQSNIENDEEITNLINQIKDNL